MVYKLRQVAVWKDRNAFILKDAVASFVAIGNVHGQKLFFVVKMLV